MRKRKSIIILIDTLIAILLLALDQFTKYLTVSGLKGKENIVLIKNVLELEYLENRGSAFGMFQNQRIFLLATGAIFVTLVILFLFKTPAEKKYYAFNLCLAGILAGGIGNMIDRFRFSYVVDFIYFKLINFPVFNVADCYIVISVIGLMILFLFVYKEDDLNFLSFKKNKKSKES